MYRRRAGVPRTEIADLVRLSFVEVAEFQTLHTVRGMLNNPLYASRLPDGSDTHFEPVIVRETWDDVQAVRETRRTRDGHPATHRTYALSMLRCSACGRRLIGDTGRYRHTGPCEASIAAYHAPAKALRGQHRRTPGHSYQAAEYEYVVGKILQRVLLGADTIAEVMTEQANADVDRFALVRIEHERAETLAAYRRHRDPVRLEAEMARLDEAEQSARSGAEEEGLDTAESVEFLRNLPALWEAAPESTRALAESLFESVEVLGLNTMHVEPTPAALRRGLAEAFRADELVMVGARGLEPTHRRHRC